MTATEFGLGTVPYRLRFRPPSGPPGAYRGRGTWSEGEFLRHVPLLNQFDPRRLDLLASFRDPFGGLHVRAFSPRRAVQVIVIADLSASMGFGGGEGGFARLAGLTRLIAASAYESGDSFGLICADSEVREDLLFPPARRLGLADEIYTRLVTATPRGTARGLVEAANLVPVRRSLVFLVSDFLMPHEDIEALLDGLWRHEVVPIVIRDSGMEGDVAPFGLAMVQDLETARKRLLFLRPKLREAWRRRVKDRLAELERIFTERGRRAFHLVDRLDVDAFADYFVGA
jgi:uncharacterized protein (DUF58 family)